jgi:hypothetical protein
MKTVKSKWMIGGTSKQKTRERNGNITKTKTKTARTPVLGILGATLGFMLLAGSLPTSASSYFNGFETDVFDWNAIPGLEATRVPSGTHGITSATGSFHAENSAAGSFSRWGGYNYGAGDAVPTVFHEYSTSVDIYLNVEGGWANNTRFDFDSAINNSAGTFNRDFIFNAGFYNDTDGSPGSGTSRFVISASNNSQPGSAFAKNPGRGPIAISTTGWYTFKHHFYDLAGVLAVDLSILDSSGTLVNSWPLSDATDLITGIGGNRYGWFDFNEFSTLAFDNALRTDASLRAQKIEVRDDLVDLRDSITDGGDRNKLLDAITHLNKSIDANNWLDELHPKPNATGEKVFNEEKSPVTKLRELRNSNHSSIPAAQLQDYIDRLLEVDRALAVTAIDEAIAANGNAGKIATAIDELNKGDDEAVNDHPDKAIEHYKNAWKNAVAAF